MTAEPLATGTELLEGVTPEPGVQKHDPILIAHGLRRQFGGLVAVDVEHLEIQRHTITGLIGPNGAGKTTFFNLLTGFDKPNDGTTHFNGRRVDTMSSHRRARHGMVRTFQLTKALSKLSVMDNMKLGATGQTGEHFWALLISPMWKSQDKAIEVRAIDLLERFSLIEKRDDFAGTLSGGQRKLLEMARALMTSPELIMLDEPMAGVNPALTQSLLEHVKKLRDEGITVVFVEHDMDVVRDISDWVVVMAEGSVIAEGSADSIGANKMVIDAYLGAHHDAPLDLDEEKEWLGEGDKEPEER